MLCICPEVEVPEEGGGRNGGGRVAGGVPGAHPTWAPAHLGKGGAALMDVSAAEDQAPLVALGPLGAVLPLPGQPAPGLPPAQLAAIVEALASGQAFAATIAARVFSTPASDAAQLN